MYVCVIHSLSHSGVLGTGKLDLASEKQGVCLQASHCWAFVAGDGG